MTSWEWQGERGMVRSFEGNLGEANAAARALAQDLSARAFEEVLDVVPGARTLLVELIPGAEPSEALVTALGSSSGEQPGRGETSHRVIVSYDGADLQDIADLAGMTAMEIVTLHASAEYTVAFIGFQPGFPYLIGLPQPLVVPRLDTPRIRVPAGSVAVAGEYTGIYPSATPGGWRLIGHTEQRLFDPSSARPALLQPGDRVRFVPA